MSYRDDEFAALARAEFLQQELERTKIENHALRAQLAYAPSREASEAELDRLRGRLEALEGPQHEASATQAFDAGLVVFLLMMVSMLIVAVIIAMH